jgi:hypothetical protein
MRNVASICWLAFACTLSANTGAAAATACEAKSPNTVVPLLDLYTSEGCDSCPPADRWLTTFAKSGFDRDRVVALAFHVDYWNYLGWTDPFAQNAFSLRQREFARRAGASTVYTPEFVLNGRDYRRWTNGDLNAELQRINRAAPRADIALALERTGTNLQVSGEASLRDTAIPANLYIALYESNLRTEVRAGENRGRTLDHDSVVRRLIGPYALDRTGKARVRESLALAADWKIGDLGVAAFVQEANGTAVLQTLALGVCP